MKLLRLDPNPMATLGIKIGETGGLFHQLLTPLFEGHTGESFGRVVIVAFRRQLPSSTL
jgi:hypothetical protein